MKANKNEPHYEVSHDSLDVLKNRVDELFSKNNLEAPWLPDHYYWEHYKHDHMPQNIVVFGSFLRTFLESGLWPWKESRIWCLCESVKKVLVEQMSLSEKQVRIIPRQLLFDAVKPSNKTLEGGGAFVYAGRMSASKGLPLLLETYRVLDKWSQGAYKLNLYGAFDEEYSESFGRRAEIKSFKEEVLHDLENKDSWFSPPVWHRKVARDEWLKKPQDEVFISLSNLYVEDFGVSLAQAQEAGARALVSEWGGHRDSGEAWKIPVEHLDFGIENKRLLKLKANLIAKILIENTATKMNSSKGCENLLIPEIVTSLDLDLKRREFVAKYGLPTLWALRAGVGYFADTKAGGQFFQKYHDCFAGREIEFETIYLLSDVDTPNENQKEIKAVCDHFHKNHPSSVHFFPLRYVFRKEVLHYILKAKHVALAVDEKITQKKAKEQLDALCLTPVEVIL